MKFVYFFLLIGLLAGIARATDLSPVQSATITDENGDDTPEIVGFGFGHTGDPNYGTTLVQKGGGQFPYERRSVEEFDLSGLSALSTATLSLLFYNSNGTSSTFETFLTSGDGLIQPSDFSLSSIPLGSRTVPGNRVSDISYDVTAIINSLLSSGATFVSVRHEIVGTGGSEVFYPHLSVTPIPEPTSYVLCLLGALSLAYARRKNIFCS